MGALALSGLSGLRGVVRGSAATVDIAQLTTTKTVGVAISVTAPAYEIDWGDGTVSTQTNYAPKTYTDGLPSHVIAIRALPGTVTGITANNQGLTLMAFPNGAGVSNINCPRNAFAQPLPALFGQLPDLTFFNCGGSGNQNQFTGDLGAAFGHVAGVLTFFDCFGNGNQFTGDLGVAFGHVAGVLTFFACGGNGNQFTNINLTIPTRAIQIFLEPYIWQPGQADATLDGLIADPTLFVTHLYTRNATNGPSPAKVSQLQALGVQVFV